MNEKADYLQVKENRSAAGEAGGQGPRPEVSNFDGLCQALPLKKHATCVRVSARGLRQGESQK